MNKFIEPTNILMIDIETKDTKVTAEIVEVGTVYAQNRSILGALHMFTHSASPANAKYTSSPSTLKFHIENDTRVLENQLRANILGAAVNRYELIDKLNELTHWIPHDTIIYCFGLSFDIPILNYTAQVEKLELYLPSYRNLRCLRTELATAKSLGFIKKVIPTAHNARDDCATQLDLLYSIFDFYKGLTNGTNN